MDLIGSSNDRDGVEHFCWFLLPSLPPSLLLSSLPISLPSLTCKELVINQTLCLRAFVVVLQSNSLWPYGLQHTRLPCYSPSPGAFSNSRPLSWWCHPTISSSVTLFSCPQSFPASGSFPVSGLFASSGQSFGASASAYVLLMNIQGWFPFGLTGLISLLSRGLSRAFSSTTIRKHQFFGAVLSLWSNSHICTWLLEKP